MFRRSPHRSLTIIAKSVVILTSAVIDEGLKQDLSVDGEEFNQHQLSRLSVFELRDNVERGEGDLSLDKVAEWLVEGPGAGIGLCSCGDGELFGLSL